MRWSTQGPCDLREETPRNAVESSPLAWEPRRAAKCLESVLGTAIDAEGAWLAEEALLSQLSWAGRAVRRPFFRAGSAVGQPGHVDGLFEGIEMRVALCGEVQEGGALRWACAALYCCRCRSEGKRRFLVSEPQSSRVAAGSSLPGFSLCGTSPFLSDFRANSSADKRASDSKN